MTLVVRQYLIAGRVQGVGYRAFARGAAARAVITGWTRNLTDGRVEVLALGRPESLTALRGELERGPDLARVDRVEEIARADVTENFIAFEQRKDADHPWPVPSEAT